MVSQGASVERPCQSPGPAVNRANKAASDRIKPTAAYRTNSTADSDSLENLWKRFSAGLVVGLGESVAIESPTTSKHPSRHRRKDRLLVTSTYHFRVIGERD